MTPHDVLTCREAFRQHAVDLQASLPQPPQPHWMLREEALKAWIGDVQKAYERVRQAGGDLLDGQPLEPEAVIRRLGFAECREPHGLLEWLVFTARMVVATTREGVRANSEIVRLHRRARCATHTPARR